MGTPKSPWDPPKPPPPRSHLPPGPAPPSHLRVAPPLSRHVTAPLPRRLWGSWAGPEGDKFGAQKYEGGTGCWQGPSRATTVRLRCALQTALAAASEPSRCEYLLELETPAACRESPMGHEEHDEL
ncbi:glucosidase 2 subunit beta [Passer domesticus]|uniref:glucosidase 2 subunit beta n=1 Tax=Passer domesticus TaxID=48849 RepID=UPI0030FE0BD8